MSDSISELTVPAALAADAQVATGTPEEATDRPIAGTIGGTGNGCASVATSNAVETAARSVLLFEIPPADREFFTRQLGHEVQREISRMLRFARAIHTCVNKEATAKRLAAQLAGTRGWSWQRIYNRYCEYRKGCVRIEGGREVHYDAGDWRIFWNKAKWPVAKAGLVRSNADRALAPAFINFLRANYERNQRGKFATFHAELLHVARDRHALNDLEFPDSGKVIKAGCKVPYIPGYEEWPDINPDTGAPDGWTLSNLQKKIKPDNFERALVTVGRAAAKNHGFKVPGTRVGARLMQFVFADDHEFNQKIIVPRQRVFLRPRGFFAVDLLSALCFGRFFKPTFWDEQAEMKRVLTQRDFIWFNVSILTKTGYRNDDVGTTVIGEHATAHLPAEIAARMADATGGKFKFEAGGRNNERGHIGQLHPVDHTDPNWRNKGRGNPRSKALVESGFNGIDNAFGSLPGQVGLSREVCPEQLPMQEEECRKILDLALSPEQMAQIIFPLLTWFEWSQRAMWLFRFIAQRRDHRIQGFEKLGFIHRTPPFELWSREEAFRAHERELTKLPLHEVPGIVGPENCYRVNGEDTVQVRNGVIEIDSREWTMDSDPVLFAAIDYNGQRLKNGERFRAYLNPSDLRTLILTDAHNRPMAECLQVPRVARHDPEAVTRAQGQAAKWFAGAVREKNELHTAGGMEIAQRYEHNGNVIAGRTLADEPRRLSEEEDLAQRAREARLKDCEPENDALCGGGTQSEKSQ